MFTVWCVWVCALSALGQEVVAQSEREALFNEIYGRSIRLGHDQQGSSEVLHHIWMASLVDDQQPVLLWDRAYYQAFLGNREATLDDLKLAYKNSDYDRYIGNALLQMAAMYGEWEIAESVSTRLLEERPDDANQVATLVNIYEQSGKLEEALATVRLLKGSARNTSVIYKEAQLLSELERTEEAEALLLDYLKEHPDEPSGTFMLVALYGNEGRTEEASRLVTELRKAHPTDPYVRRFSIAYYAMSGLNEAIAEEIRKEAERPGTDPADLVQMMDIAQEESKDPAGLITALLPLQKELYERYPGTEAFAYKQASAHLILKDTVAAEDILSRMIERGSKERIPYHFFLGKYAMAEDTVALDRVITAGLANIPEDGMVRLYSIIMDAQRGDSIGYVRKVDEAVEVVARSDRFYGQLALMKADEELKRDNWEEAKKYYEASVAVNPSAIALNNYAYALTTHGTPDDLKKAEDMARMAVQNSDNQPSHLDTYAWVLYKRGSYSMAKLYMEKAIDAMKEPDALYYEHLAAILTALREYEEAIGAWEKVIRLDGDREKAEKAIKELRSKIQSGE